MAHHQKEGVYEKARGLEVDILTNLTNVDASIFNPSKEHPCPVCGGKTRFRYRKRDAAKLDRPFYCNHCGSRNWMEMLVELTGLSFMDAVNMAGDYLGCIPVEQLEVKKLEQDIAATFPTWYQFNPDVYNTIKKEATVDLSAWQRVSGLNMLDILKHGDDALIPLLNNVGNPCDFVCMDADGQWQTTGGSQIVPDGFCSVFGESQGKYNYIAVSPFVAAHASVFMQRKVICVYHTENIWEVGKHHEDPPVIIVTNIEEVTEADMLKFKQLTFNAKTHTVNKRLWEPYEIVESRKERG